MTYNVFGGTLSLAQSVNQYENTVRWLAFVILIVVESCCYFLCENHCFQSDQLSM